MNLAETFVGQKMIEQGIRLILNNPERNLNRLVNWADKIARDPDHKQAIAAIKTVLTDETSNWHAFARKLLREIHPNIRQRMAINFFLNSTLLGIPRQREMSQKLGVSIPWAILMDPTEKCNLSCTGCWAGDYQRESELPFKLMDRICDEAEEVGINFIVLSGGEPLVKRWEIAKLAEHHPNQVFHLFTNGTILREDFVEEIVRRGNITLAFSVEGLKNTTDGRRGEGVFDKVMEKMDLMREAGALFGFSTTYTSNNTEEVGSDKFIDLMIQKGAAYAWYFTYIPIGKDVDLKFMATPQQRAYMFERIQYFRRTKSIFPVDFWNDGEASNGCIAGGRRYFHINANGDVEPCAFVHYTTCNIKDLSLVEALQNSLFQSYHNRQPFSRNLRRPCPLIDVPEAMREMIKESGARGTQLHDNESIDEFCDKMACYSQAWSEVADTLWEEEGGKVIQIAR